MGLVAYILEQMRLWSTKNENPRRPTNHSPQNDPRALQASSNDVSKGRKGSRDKGHSSSYNTGTMENNTKESHRRDPRKPGHSSKHKQIHSPPANDFDLENDLHVPEFSCDELSNSWKGSREKGHSSSYYTDFKQNPTQEPCRQDTCPVARRPKKKKQEETIMVDIHEESKVRVTPVNLTGRYTGGPAYVNIQEVIKKKVTVFVKKTKEDTSPEHQEAVDAKLRNIARKVMEKDEETITKLRRKGENLSILSEMVRKERNVDKILKEYADDDGKGHRVYVMKSRSDGSESSSDSDEAPRLPQQKGTANLPKEENIRKPERLESSQPDRREFTKSDSGKSSDPERRESSKSQRRVSSEFHGNGRRKSV